jgi:hypothetical protein
MRPIMALNSLSVTQVHHWSHTWLNKVKEDDLVEIWSVVNSTRAKLLDNTLFSEWR